MSDPSHGRGRSESLTATVDTDFPGYRTPPADPVALLASWLEECDAQKVREPRALALATADTRGRSSSRTVTVASVTDAGLVFLTHADSRKGRELAENPWASGVLYWRETGRQVTLAGPVQRMPHAQAQARWQARPVFTHAMSTASRQSRPLESLDDVARLRAAARELAAPPRPLPCPDRFAAYQLLPEEVEFWANGTDRLHERLRYDRDAQGWRSSRLQP
ncbi:pyridoxamine 5'-phosphate oxidase [Streptomyces populi]|uniref:Pyridoxamine 5'-phosphate oxidase n=1 Tax=Streptomyces populi TaxID=2058924 RepID=A0A2I0SBI2_9ACTN|nr:phenazine biosynthesis FMN-dependent oxidase PhzG [Streptomyces populi]PKT67290.1 pyridoxamine 5'-phosphate oxidase [Streptomyces populi]